jgi:flagellar hook-associated protein 2
MSSISNALSSIFSPVSVEPANSGTSNSSSSGSSGNSAGSSSSSTTPASSFVGTSEYSAQLASEVSREVEIAQLPIELLQNQQSTLTAQSNEMTTIDQLVGNLQSAVVGIQDAMYGSSYNSQVTDASGNDSSAVSVNLDDSAQEGVYGITVNSLGAYALGETTSNWSDQNTVDTFNLAIGGTTYPISTTDTTAAGVAAAINQQEGSLVQATVVNLSPTDTRIALQATSLGQQSLDLQSSDGTSLFDQSIPGSQAEYTVPGGSPVYTNSRSVEVSPGVTLTMQATTTAPLNITVSRSDTALGDAMSSFASAYNAVIDEINAQHGQSAGPLQGNPILTTITNTLRQISLYTASYGSVSSIYNLGLELNANGNMNGHLTFNSYTLAGADIQNSSDVTSFLGSSDGSGFLQFASNLINDLEAPSTGLLKNAESDVQTQISDLGTTISTKQDQVSQLQTNLTNQMSQADALIAETEQQFSYMNEMFQAQQLEMQSYTGL